MHFASKHFLYGLLLLIPLFVFMLYAWKKRQAVLSKFMEMDLAVRLTKNVSLRKKKIKELLLFIVVFLCLIALSGLEYGYKLVEINRRGIDVMIVVDVSKSMLAGDVSPSRLERAKREIEDLLNVLQGDRVGLIAFAGRAFVMTPQTLDYSAIYMFADSLSPDLIPVPGTAVATSIELALRALEKGNPESSAIILISDGEDLGGEVLETAKVAKEQGVRIYTLGVGTPAGAPIPLKEGGFMKDRNGNMVLTKLNSNILEDIANTTHGKAFNSVSGDKDLELIYKNINRELDEKELKSGKQKRYVNRFQLILFLALILLMIESLLGERRSSKGDEE